MRKRALCLVLAMLMLMSMLPLMGHQSVYSSDQEFKTFIQGDDRWGNYVYGSSRTIRRSGCMITSIAILEAYADESLRDVNVWNPEVCAKTFSYAGDNIYWGSSSRSSWQLVQVNKGYANKEDLLADIIKFKNEGLYIILWGKPRTSNSHYSPIVGWNTSNGKNEPLVWDVATGDLDTTWQQFMDGGEYDLVVYRSTIKPSTETIFTSTDNYAGLNSNDGYQGTSGLTTEQKAAAQSVQREWELNGMPTKAEMSGTSIVVPDRTELSKPELENLEFIKEQQEAKKLKAEQVISTICTFVGILMIIYALLLVMGFVFDSVNSFIDISFVHLLTFGAINVITDRDDYEQVKGKKGYATVAKLIAIVLVILAIGILFINGTVLRLLYKLVSKI